MGVSRVFIIFGFIILGIVSRLLPHPPNANTMNALALFGTAYLGSRSLAIAVLFASMFLGDFVIGMHSTMLFVYGTLALTVLLGDQLKNSFSLQKSLFRAPAACIAASLLFFVVVNFGVWMTTSMYPKTFSGLGMCYLAAVPFLANQMWGDLFYGMFLFGVLSLRPARISYES